MYLWGKYTPVLSILLRLILVEEVDFDQNKAYNYFLHKSCLYDEMYFVYPTSQIYAVQLL